MNRLKYGILSLFFFGAVLLTLLSCQNKVTKTVNGWWTIDTIYYNGYDVRICLFSNSLFFDKEMVELPTGQNVCDGINVFSETGTWEIINEEGIPLYLLIDSDNEIFAGKHQLIFYKDEKNKLLKTKLISDDLYVIARKGLFNFDQNISLIDDLIEASN